MGKSLETRKKTHGICELGLRLLQDGLQEAIVLYTAEHAYTHDGRITALPLDRLWT